MILESFWDHVGIILGSVWDHVGTVFEAVWDEFRAIYGPFFFLGKVKKTYGANPIFLSSEPLPTLVFQGGRIFQSSLDIKK